VPYPPLVNKPETPLADELLAPNAQRIRRAIAELR
jgi:hypothetical protein